MYTAMLRLDPAVSLEERAELVHLTLDLLGLAKCAHYSCDKASKQKLSGGQMRRVGIGAELVTRPSILMLDEPTSALDAVNTRLVVESLRMLANRGILVVASLHQPRFSVYGMQAPPSHAPILLVCAILISTIHWFASPFAWGHASRASLALRVGACLTCLRRPSRGCMPHVHASRVCRRDARQAPHSALG